MPSLIAPNVAQVVMRYANGGDYSENVYHVQYGTGWDATSLAALTSAFINWETTVASLIRSDEVALIRVTATDLTSLASSRDDAILAVPVPGGVSSPVLPPNVTWAIKGNIGERGRGRNGRCFWIGLAESMVVGALVNGSIAAGIETALNDLITDIAVAIPGAILGVIHQYAAGVQITPATFSEILAWVYTDLTCDSQRDRLPNHKRHA